MDDLGPYSCQSTLCTYSSSNSLFFFSVLCGLSEATSEANSCPLEEGLGWA